MHTCRFPDLLILIYCCVVFPFCLAHNFSFYTTRFELAYTHTMYYLAQVYKNLGAYEVICSCKWCPLRYYDFLLDVLLYLIIFVSLRSNWACCHLLPQHPAETVAVKSVQSNGVGSKRCHAVAVLHHQGTACVNSNWPETVCNFKTKTVVRI